MKRKILISLSVLGIMFVGYFFVALAYSGFDFRVVFGTEERTPASEIFQEAITELKVEIASDDLVLKKSLDGAVHVNYYESKAHQYKFYVENGLLKIQQKRAWYAIFSFSKSKELEISLPGDLVSGTFSVASGDIGFSSGLKINDLSITASSGNIAIEGGFSENATIAMSSGTVKLKDLGTETLNISSSSGNIILENVVSEAGTFKLSSGNIDLKDSEIKNLDISASSGNIKGTNVSFENGEIKCSSGNVSFAFPEADAELYRLQFRTSSGRIEVRGGEYDIKGSGNLNLGTGPKLLEIHVSSGNITVTFGV